MPPTGQIQPEKATWAVDREEEEHPWAVYVHNDDVTPLDFVVHILFTVFDLPTPNAAHVTYSAHLNGKAYVRTLPRHEALRRVGKARFAARLSGFPLEFSMEPD